MPEEQHIECELKEGHRLDVKNGRRKIWATFDAKKTPTGSTFWLSGLTIKQESGHVFFEETAIKKDGGGHEKVVGYARKSFSDDELRLLKSGKKSQLIAEYFSNQLPHLFQLKESFLDTLTINQTF